MCFPHNRLKLQDNVNWFSMMLSPTVARTNSYRGSISAPKQQTAGELWKGIDLIKEKEYSITKGSAKYPKIFMIYLHGLRVCCYRLFLSTTRPDAQCHSRRCRYVKCQALWNLAVLDDNKKAIARAGGISPLVMLLRHGSPAGKEAAAGALLELAFDDDNKVLIASAGGIGPLLQLLESGDEMAMETAAGAPTLPSTVI
jgi:hypothetical protein